jgi:hypothetical protein
MTHFRISFVHFIQFSSAALATISFMGTSNNDVFVVGSPPLWRDAHFHC